MASVDPTAAGQSPITQGTADIPLVVRFMQVLAERHDALQTLITDQINAIDAGTAELNELREALQLARDKRPEGDSDETFKMTNTDNTTLLVDTCDKYGIEHSAFDEFKVGEINGSQADYDSLISNIETEIDSRSGNSQIQTIQLQSLIQKDDANMTMMNSIVSGDGQQMKELSRW